MYLAFLFLKNFDYNIFILLFFISDINLLMYSL